MPNDSDAVIAGYPLLDDGTLFPGGRAFATHDPQTRAPLILKRYRAEWLLPADSLDNFQTRARAAISIQHPRVQKLRDANFIGSDVYAVVEPFDGASLETLVKDIGPMPAFLACDFVRQAALGLAAAHAVGVMHGDVVPANLMVGPLVNSSKTHPDGTPIQRPATDASAMLTGLGLIPKRPSGREWAAIDPLGRFVLGFLPPERVESGDVNVGTDVYGLGATLFYLLAGRPPYVAPSAADVIVAIANTPPAPLGTLRPDLPPGLADAVMALIAKSPSARPHSAAEVANRLGVFAEPEPVALTPAPPEVAAVAPDAWNISEISGPVDADDHLLAPAADPHEAFATAHSEAAAEPKEPRKKSSMTETERAKLRLWLYMGGFFWFVMVPLLWLVLLSDSGCFSGKKSESPKPETPTKRKRGTS